MKHFLCVQYWPWVSNSCCSSLKGSDQYGPHNVYVTHGAHVSQRQARVYFSATCVYPAADGGGRTDCLPDGIAATPQKHTITLPSLYIHLSCLCAKTIKGYSTLFYSMSWGLNQTTAQTNPQLTSHDLFTHCVFQLWLWWSHSQIFYLKEQSPPAGHQCSSMLI